MRRRQSRRFHQLHDDARSNTDSEFHPAFASRRTSQRSYSERGGPESIRLSVDSAAQADRSYFDFSGPRSSTPLAAMVSGSTVRSPSHASLVQNIDASVVQPTRPMRPPRPDGLNISLSQATTVVRPDSPSSTEVGSSYPADVKLPLPETPTTGRPLPRVPVLPRLQIQSAQPPPTRQTWGTLGTLGTLGALSSTGESLPAYTPV